MTTAWRMVLILSAAHAQLRAFAYFLTPPPQAFRRHSTCLSFAAFDRVDPWAARLHVQCQGSRASRYPSRQWTCRGVSACRRSRPSADGAPPPGPSSPSALEAVSLNFNLDWLSRRGTDEKRAKRRDGINDHKVLVLGSTGFVGTKVVELLNELEIPHVCASRTGGGGGGVCEAIDLTSPAAPDQLRTLARGCTAVVSMVGSIFDLNDESTNAAPGRVAAAAREAGVCTFVCIGNDERVRDFARWFPPLTGYARGKDEAERAIHDAFGRGGYCIVQPTFIYGGDDLALVPPRVPASIGQVAEDILGLYPLQALADALPGMLGVAFGPPVSRDRVAAAAVNAALGLINLEECPTLASRDEIILAACKRPKRSAGTLYGKNMKLAELKDRIYNFGDASVSPEKTKEAFDLLEAIEARRPPSVRPASDSRLDGRWDWSFDVEPDAGTGVIKEMLEGRSPLGPFFGLKDVHMDITDKRKFIRISVSAQILGLPADLMLTTSLAPDPSDPEGTMFKETFDGIKIAGFNLPIPSSWKRSRPLEISYLDDDMFVVRGNGGEPHFLYNKQ